MSERAPFYAQRRLKELKATIASAPSFFDMDVEHEVLTFLDDLAKSVSLQAGDDDDQAFSLIVRCMGAIAEANAEYAYTAWGLENPFKDSPPTLGLIPPAPEPTWTWPVIHHPPASAAPGGFSGTFREYSALKMFGYTVGKTDGWPTAKRQDFLTDFMERDLPPIVHATFGDEYGDPMSTTRLRKMANVIATNASNFYRNDPIRYRAAIEDWERDLDFLKTQYYIGAGLAFQPWPSSRPD
jgi:hypothetical protein